MRRLVPLVLVCAIGLTAAVDAPSATLRRERRVSSVYRQGLARFGDGWVFSGTSGLWRTGDDLRADAANPSAIPDDLRARGYNQIGDVDVAGAYLYAPLEQPDLDRDEQVMARYDAKSLEFVDAVTLTQHENPFVAVEARSGTAFSMDRSGADELLRYDLGGLRWRPLPPLRLDRRVANVEGADLGGGFAYLSTSDPKNTLYRVDLGSGEVIDLGSAGHVGGESGGIDVTPLSTGRVHTLAIDRDRTTVLLDEFSVPSPRKTGRAEQAIIAITVAATAIATIVIVVLTRRRGRRTTGQ